MTEIPEGRIITRVLCPQGHIIASVVATREGLMLHSPHSSVRTHARRDTQHDQVDRDRSGEMLARLREPGPGEFTYFAPECVVCAQHFEISLREFWDWAAAEKRRVTALPR